MKPIPLPAFTDNYIWLLHDAHQALLVDPGNAQPVLAALQQRRLQLETILVTHHHADHAGGVDTLRQATQALDATTGDEVSIFAALRQRKNEFQ